MVWCDAHYIIFLSSDVVRCQKRRACEHCVKCFLYGWPAWKLVSLLTPVLLIWSCMHSLFNISKLVILNTYTRCSIWGTASSTLTPNPFFMHTSICGIPTVNTQTSYCLFISSVSGNNSHRRSFFFFFQRDFLIAFFFSQWGELFCCVTLFSSPKWIISSALTRGVRKSPSWGVSLVVGEWNEPVLSPWFKINKLPTGCNDTLNMLLPLHRFPFHQKSRVGYSTIIIPALCSS